MSHNILKIPLLGLLLVLHHLVYSQADAKYMQNPDTTIYVLDHTDLLTLRFYPLAKFNSLEIKGPSERISMQPNGKGSVGIGFNYKSIGFGFSVGLPATDESNVKYGQTRRFDLQMSYYGEKLAADGYFQEYEGYYLANPTSITNWKNPNYPQSADLRVASLGGTIHYIFNSEKYSYKAAYLRNQIQKKSAGSFIAGLFAFLDEVSSDFDLLPDSLVESVRQTVDIKAFNSASFGVTGGYMYTFVIKRNFFINVGLAPGIGYRKSFVETRDGSEKFVNALGILVQTRIALGYEFRTLFLGATYSSILRNFNHENAEVNLGTGQIRFIIGKRFDVSKKRP